MNSYTRHTMALFGEAERGEYKKGYFLRDLSQLVDIFGHPPQESQGLFFAIQALLYERDVIYFRVKEEGFSQSEYCHGLKLLETDESVMRLSAICMPGVGCPQILAASDPVCQKRKSILITSQRDLYDYLTSR